MEKAKISAKQFFALVVLFEMGSAILVGFPSQLKQDAWIAVILGMVSGIALFFIYYHLFLYYPDLPLTSYVQKIFGKWIGRILAFFYILYFAYIAARVLRDFGELLTTTIYTNTPIFFLMTLLMLSVVYAILKGFEVIARVGELYFGVVYIMAIVGFFLIIFSGLLHLDNLKPILENGWKPVIKTVLKDTLTFPFGEMVVFTMLLPYLKQPKKAKIVCISGMILSGINFTIATIINIATLGVALFARSPYPLLSTISKIELASFIERLDVLFMLYLMIAGFIKVAVFFYAAVIGTTDLFQLKDHRKISFPMGILILLTAMMIAPNYSEHIEEGLRIVPIYLHWPFQIIIPFLLLVVAIIRHKFQQKKAAVSS
ncbi:GerAB/ArcD/ProY family transporter [Bacillus sp. BRMEA1]|uniref:GerAB/ArcD/ProY family transporter n=1 Tax=Neobacillus endophyticus TaxID=2738405 RepID=UPI001563C88F|nr:GerAB/ArcD/ProY family transporter [Neobacillus endophyticus]NRD79331.1 GerAB/ArcD/ProY family transporter [Neobacillus endophyticus]